jgi:putative acetyltransferase
MTTPAVISPDDLAHIRTLFCEYQAFLALNLDYQNFDAELANLPGRYAPPTGNLYLARWQHQPAGCAAYYQPDPEAQPGVCEIKRVFVRQAFQGVGLGKALMLQAMHDAAQAGYHTMRLDSLARLKPAVALYQRLGFVPTPSFNHDPNADVVYLACDLSEFTTSKFAKSHTPIGDCYRIGRIGQTDS